MVHKIESVCLEVFLLSLMLTHMAFHIAFFMLHEWEKLQTIYIKINAENHQPSGGA